MRPEFLAPWLGIFGGLLDSTSGGANDFADFAPSNEHFQNLSFFVSTASLLLVPNITLGGERHGPLVTVGADDAWVGGLGLRFVLQRASGSAVSRTGSRRVVVVQDAPDLADHQWMRLGRVSRPHHVLRRYAPEVGALGLDDPVVPLLVGTVAPPGSRLRLDANLAYGSS